MPVYEYVCPSCDSKEEKALPMSERSVEQTCSKCGKPLTKVPSTYNFSI